MHLFSLVSILLTFTAIFAFLNYKLFRLPTAVGLMLSALVFSLAIMAFGNFYPALPQHAKMFVTSFDFSTTILEGILSYLLFAGAINMSTMDLKKEKMPIAVLASVGVIISTTIIGFVLYGITKFGQINLPIMYCFVFGALISPTDAVAALSTLRSAKLPKYLESRIAGEALFNDGTGLVVFFIFLTLATGSATLDGFSIFIMLIREILGGIALGVAFGWVSMLFLKRSPDPRIRLFVTLACASAGYALALKLGTSAPITVVVSGLWIGHFKSQIPTNQEGPSPVAIFWELIDEILNASLFVLIGLYLLALPLEYHEFFAGFLMIPVVLFARFVSVGSIMEIFRFLGDRHKKTSSFLMTWGGMRGGVSVALALSIADEPIREIIVSMTYIVVAFSVLVQGITINKFIKPEEKE